MKLRLSWKGCFRSLNNYEGSLMSLRSAGYNQLYFYNRNGGFYNDLEHPVVAVCGDKFLRVVQPGQGSGNDNVNLVFLC